MRDLNQKGNITIIVGVVILLLIFGTGIYYLYTQKGDEEVIIKQSSQIDSSLTAHSEPENIYINTTLGYKVNLLEKWTACDPTYHTGGRVRIARDHICSMNWEDSFIMDTALNHPMGPVVRKPEESFLDWVKRYSQKDTDYLEPPDRIESEFIHLQVNPQVIVEKRTYYMPDTHDKITYGKELYIEDSQATAFILGAEDPTGGHTKDATFAFPLEQFIPLVKSTPITTGDITGVVSVKLPDGGSGEIHPDFTGSLYQDDKKTIALPFKIDKDGLYFVRIKPGTYYFIHPNGKEEKITVSLGKETIFRIELEE